MHNINVSPDFAYINVIFSINDNWQAHVVISREARLELQWWLENLVSISNTGRVIRPSSEVVQVDHSVAGDASGVGLYIYKSNGDQATLLSAAMSQQESQQSSTYREVLVFHRFYTSLEAARFRGQTLLHIQTTKARLASCTRAL